MSTFVASLFLPYTIDFHEDETDPETGRPNLLRVHSRAVSSTDTATNAKRNTSTASLFTGPAPPLTPVEDKQNDFFSQFNPSDPRSAFPTLKSKDPRSVLRHDPSVPEWGSAAQFLNQPKSRAPALPSGNILDYVQMEKPKKHHQRRQTGSKSRRGSHEREFENKTWTIEPGYQGNGGLVNAIRGLESERNRDDPRHEKNAQSTKVFVGTLGFPTDALSDSRKSEIHEKLENEHDALTVFPCDRDLDGHYGHYCKTILWPVFHYQIPDHPKSKAYEDHSWEFYRGLNQSFADKIISGYKHGDIIWVHDYHLLLVPGMIRKVLPEAKIGFFLHAAFPSSEVFRCLSTRKELLEGMLGANLVAFQTREYAQHFLQTCSRLLTVEANGEGVQLDDRFVNVTSQPIGIDPPQVLELKEEEEVKEWVSVLQERYKGKHLIVARDKLDNIRGVRQKLLAYELFLNMYPEWANRVVLIQVATSTTENSDLLATVSDIVTRIDSVHSTLAHQPLVFLKQDIAFSQYLALLTVADVLMITSLREGMNLAPHEFILCQDGSSGKKHGPVILSEFTGSAAVFGGNEIAVNPWDYLQCAKAIKQALDMDVDEKQRRYNKLRQVVMHHTGAYWAQCLEEALHRAFTEQTSRNAMSIPRLSVPQLAETYKAAHRRVFVLDYEGTLASYGTDTNVALTSPKKVLDALNDLVSDRKNIVYVMSGRAPEELQRLFNQVPGLGLIAENGCFLREHSARQSEWITFADLDDCASWKKDIRPILQYYCDRVQGSWIEERYCSLVFHYEKAEDPRLARTQAGDCVNHINDSCDAYRVQAVPSGKAVLVEQLDWSKGTAAVHIFDRLREKNVINKGLEAPDFVLVAGDDREDEPIFEWANKQAHEGHVQGVSTVSIGKRNTRAKFTLTQGTAGLLSALQRLATYSRSASPDYFGTRKDAIGAN
ncbi:hypothetical protein AAFC00_002520 [Neodothiora populina]|uniref:Glycosyltransferase family 20 protein n=1 Tax=Neodothiora populina TaxID=2781224 RepID=A0ABR3P7D3_9PEZI